MVTVTSSAGISSGIQAVDPIVVQTAKEFFLEHLGTVIGATLTNRRNSQQQRPSIGSAYTAVTVHVMMDNVAIFGARGDFLCDVHPRIRYLNTRLHDRLRDMGVLSDHTAGSIGTAIMPYPNPDGWFGSLLPQEMHFSRAERVVPIAELAVHHDHWRRVMDEYGAQFVCITNNGTAVGPDAGLLATARAVAEESPHPLRVYEFGSGTATLATMLDRQGKLAKYEGVDFSQPMVDHFEAHVQPALTAVGGGAVILGSCMESPLPSEIDLLCVAVYYEAQPTLIQLRGKELAHSLGDTGVLIAQTGTLEDPLVTALVAGWPGVAERWPWYDADFSLRTWFPFVVEVLVEEQAVVLASRDAKRLSMALHALEPDVHLLDLR